MMPLSEAMNPELLELSRLRHECATETQGHACTNCLSDVAVINCIPSTSPQQCRRACSSGTLEYSPVWLARGAFLRVAFFDPGLGKNPHGDYHEDRSGHDVGRKARTNRGAVPVSENGGDDQNDNRYNSFDVVWHSNLVVNPGSWVAAEAPA